MESFMPSEIARLVLGYLKETLCSNAADDFLRECPYLKEYSECLRSGYEYPTNVGGKNLRKILHEYYCLRLATDKRRIGQTPPKMPVKTPCYSWNESQTTECPPKVRKDVCVQTDEFFPLATTQSNRMQSVSCSPIRFSDKQYKTSLRCPPENEIRNCQTDDNDSSFRSPRRKIHQPKKHVTIDVPSPVGKKPSCTPNKVCTPNKENDENMDGSSEDSLDLMVLLNSFINSKDLPEKIAENINKAVNTSHSRNEEDTNVATDSESIDMDAVIKDVLNRTESDPVFEDLLNNFLVLKNDEQSDEMELDLPAVDCVSSQAVTCTNGINKPVHEIAVESSSLECSEIPICDSIVEIENNDPAVISLPQFVNPAAISSFPKSQILFVSSDNGRPVSRRDAGNTGTQLSTLPSLCFPSSTNVVLKTPHKNGQIVHVFTVAPGEVEWPTLSDANIVMSSPYQDLLKLVETDNNDTRKVMSEPVNKQARKNTRITRAKPMKHKLPEMQILNPASRIDCHVVRNLNFTTSSTNGAITSGFNKVIPGEKPKTSVEVKKRNNQFEKTINKDVEMSNSQCEKPSNKNVEMNKSNSQCEKPLNKNVEMNKRNSQCVQPLNKDDEMNKECRRSPVLECLVNSVQRLAGIQQRGGSHVRVLSFKTPVKPTEIDTLQQEDIEMQLTPPTSTRSATPSIASPVTVGEKRTFHNSDNIVLHLGNKRVKLSGEKAVLNDIDVDNFLSKLHYVE